MGLISQVILVKWNSTNKKHYESKGYKFTKMGDEFEIKVKDLSNGSGVKVEVKCDNADCEKPYLIPMMWKDYLRWIKEDGRYYCNNCAKILYANKNSIITKLNNSKSFEQWCMENNKKDVLNRWDYELNNCNPNEIFCSSNKKYYFKCSEGLHKSELKYVNNFIHGHEGSLFCNSISNTHPDLIKYFANIGDTKKYSAYSGKRVLMTCQDCGLTKNIIISSLKLQGFSCSRCGDRISYPNKFIFNLLCQLGVDFNSEKMFSWSDNKRYDFYIPSVNCIIEAHGRQHYCDCGFNSYKRGRTLQEEQENDKLKEQLAKENAIEHYIVIDCSKSELEFVKKNVINSDLSNLFDLSEVDWLKCGKYANKNILKQVCNLWKSKKYNITDIAKILKLSNNTIRTYLKRGTKLGWCEYVPIIGKHIVLDEVVSYVQ